MSNSRGKILVTYHKKYPLLEESFIVPVHVGRAASESTKDGKIDRAERKWLKDHLIGDDTGVNISVRNREYSECTGLYWFWKNYDYDSLDYVGIFQYRRQLILNDLYNRAPSNKNKNIYKCVSLSKDIDVCAKAGINENKIIELLSEYDYIIPYRTSLERIGIKSVYEDYMKKIPGVHISDLFILEDVFAEVYPELLEKLREYLASPSKMMYQLFITKPTLFNMYCQWLFDLLLKIDSNIDSSLYTVNGRRTMGYLAEILYGFYFTAMIPENRAFRTGVTFLE